MSSTVLPLVVCNPVDPMRGGRKNLKRAVGEESLTLKQGQSIMQVVALRGSNLIEVMDAKGKKALALFPAKFQKSIWIKHGSFVVVDESGREQAIESGRKVTCIVSQVLFHEQVRALQKSPEWPEIFKSSMVDNSRKSSLGDSSMLDGNQSNSSEDELPPIEANMNRRKPFKSDSDTESNSDTDS